MRNYTSSSFIVSSLRLLSAFIYCLFLCDIASIQVKVLGHNETGFSKQRIILRCSDDQKINEFVDEIQLCKVKPMQRCVLYSIRMSKDDTIIHPYQPDQKVCIIFQRSTINVSKVYFWKLMSSMTAVHATTFQEYTYCYISGTNYWRCAKVFYFLLTFYFKECSWKLLNKDGQEWPGKIKYFKVESLTTFCDLKFNGFLRFKIW